MPNLECPVLVIHGTRDELVPFEHGQVRSPESNVALCAVLTTPVSVLGRSCSLLARCSTGRVPTGSNEAGTTTWKHGYGELPQKQCRRAGSTQYSILMLLFRWLQARWRVSHQRLPEGVVRPAAEMDHCVRRDLCLFVLDVSCFSRQQL